jgi:2-succinyl-6-hydroxy-2,4-cyclohexadiene-1-carboxylate synthase
LLDQLGIARAHVVGLSLGAAIAVNFALAYPGRVLSLGLTDAVLHGFRWSAELSAIDGAVWQAVATGGIAAAKERWLNHPLFAPARANPQAASRLARIVSDYSGWHFVNDDPHRQAERPAIDRLGEISVPTLVVVGERDLPDFHAIAETLAQGIGGARRVVLPNVGHMANMEAPQQFNAAVMEFLAPPPHGQANTG